MANVYCVSCLKLQKMRKSSNATLDSRPFPCNFFEVSQEFRVSAGIFVPMLVESVVFAPCFFSDGISLPVLARMFCRFPTVFSTLEVEPGLLASFEA